MNQADDATLLTTAYREEIELYRQAFSLALAAEGGDHEWTRRINDLFRRIDTIEKRTAAVRKRWQESGATDPTVRTVTAEVASLIAALQSIVGATTQRIEQRRQSLMPEVVAVVQADRVRQAYRRADRFGAPRDRRPG
jgi:hypothetical protein